METEQQGLLGDEKEEETSCKEHKKTQLEQQEIFVDKVKSTIPFHIAQSTSVDTDRSKETDGKIPLFGNEWQNMGLGTEESKGFSFNMHKFQGKEPFICLESCSKETSCLMSNVHGTESSGECVNNTTTSKSKGKMSLIGVRRQKNGRYGAVITDRVRHKQVWLGTFDTVEEASQAYFYKKLELENQKLNQQGNKENLDQIQQPGSPIVQCLSVANDQTLDTAGVSRINSHETTHHVIEVHKNNWSREEPETSKETSCLMANVHGTKSSNECSTPTNCRPTGKRSLLGIRKQKNGRYGAVITDQIRHKQVWLGTFDTVEEASQAYFSKRFELAKLSRQGNKDNEPKENCDPIQQPESPVVLASLSVVNDQTLDTAGVDRRNRRIDSHETATHIVEVHKIKMSKEEPESSKETPCLMASVHGTESSNECNSNTSNPKAKISLIGVRRQKNGRYGAVIRDRTRRKQLWLGTFNTVEEASQAYLSKKSELENKKLNQQGTKENRPKENCDQIQQPESPVLASSSVANDQTSDTARLGRRNRRIDSHETTTHFVEIHKNNRSGEEPKSCKETPCLMANVRGTESSDECNTSKSNPKAKIGLIGVRRQKNGRYGAVIRDRTRHKQVWLGTFDTVEEASQAYLTKKSELKKLGQQNNKDNKPKKHCDQVQQPEPPVMSSLSGANHDQTLNTAQVSRRNKKIDFHKTPPHFFRVYKRKDSGKYTSEIRNPITKKRIWLGSFVTAEEAFQAYQSKELEFKKLVDSKRRCGNEHTHSTQDGKSVKLVNVKQGHENVNCEVKSSGDVSVETDVRFSNSSSGETEQRIDSHEIGTGEEAFYAYLSKKFNLQSSEKQEGEEDDEDKCLGEWVQLPGNRAVKFSLKLGLPIVDNYGSLLGEFSTLDDLSICKTEDGNEAWLCFA